jgi:hypothetical protein
MREAGGPEASILIHREPGVAGAQARCLHFATPPTQPSITALYLSLFAVEKPKPLRRV